MLFPALLCRTRALPVPVPVPIPRRFLLSPSDPARPGHRLWEGVDRAVQLRHSPGGGGNLNPGLTAPSWLNLGVRHLASCRVSCVWRTPPFLVKNGAVFAARLTKATLRFSAALSYFWGGDGTNWAWPSPWEEEEEHAASWLPAEAAASLAQLGAGTDSEQLRLLAI